MSKKDAITWWNKTIYDDDSDSIPSIPHVEQASLIWSIISPVILSHTRFTTNIDEYWGSVRSIVQKVMEKDVADPLSDFESFLVSLYESRSVLFPKTVGACLLYIQKFYDGVDFFISKFFYSVSDPYLAYITVYSLINKNHPLWVSFISEYGATERFYDLSITYLGSLSENDFVENIDFRLEVARVITNIITQSHDLILSESIFSSLFQRLLNLIMYSNPIAAVSFFRCALQLFDYYFEQLSKDNQLTYLSSLFGAASHTHLLYSLSVSYISKKMQSIGEHTIIIAALSTNNYITLYPLETLESCFSTFNSHSQSSFVRYLCRLMANNLIWMRASGALLASILRNNQISGDIIEWLESYFLRLFIFIKSSHMHDKYINRAVTLCEVLSSEIFNGLDWLQKLIFSSAAAAFALDNGPPCLTEFFDINYEKNPSFVSEYSRFKDKKIPLKTFPFKPNSSSLFDKNSRKNQSSLSQQLNDQLRNINLDATSLKYVYIDTEAGPIEQQQAIFSLEDFIDQEKERLNECLKNHNEAKFPSSDRFMIQGHLMMNAIIYYMREGENNVWQYQKSALEEYIGIAQRIIEAIKKHPNLLVNVKLLSNDLLVTTNEDIRYKKLREKRHILKRYSIVYGNKYIVPNYEILLRGELSTSFFKFDSKIGYSPPSMVDFVLKEYLIRSPFNDMIEATASVISDGTMEAALSTITELNNAIRDSLGGVNDSMSTILFFSLVRYIFDCSYTVQSELNRYRSANVEFMKRCEHFTKQSIGDVGLPDYFIGNMRRKASVATLFRSKKAPSFQAMEFIMNPIDLLYQIYVGVNSVSTLVPQGTNVSASDQQVLLKCIIALNPPSNAISIMKFLEKWGNILQSHPIIQSKSTFSSTIIQFMSLGEVKDDLLVRK